MRSAMLGIVACVVGVTGGACPNRVSQDLATGPDGDIAGAVPMQFTMTDDVVMAGRVLATAGGIVTYPGGDRVDWKFLDLSVGERGAIDVELRWTPPRPGLRLAVDVFDSEHRLLDRARSRRSPAHAHVDGVRGRLYFRVYAVGRGDAGRYRLSVAFKSDPPPIDWLAVELPDPPDLPAVPDECQMEPRDPPACDGLPPCPPDTQRGRRCCPEPPDVNNRACWDKMPCPSPRDPRVWACGICDVNQPHMPACRLPVCPTPPDVGIAACWSTMPCPSPPDRRVKACHQSWDCRHPDPDRPLDACREPPLGRIVSVSIAGGDVIVTIDRGTDDGVDRTSRPVVLRGDSVAPLPGGDITLVRVDKRVSIGRVKLAIDVVKANLRVRFTLP